MTITISNQDTDQMNISYFYCSTVNILVDAIPKNRNWQSAAAHCIRASQVDKLKTILLFLGGKIIN